MKYTECGFGIPHLLSTEIEEGGQEHRVRGLVRMRPVSFYMRIQAGTSVVILDTRDGLKTSRKPYRAFKAVFGIRGT